MNQPFTEKSVVLSRLEPDHFLHYHAVCCLFHPSLSLSVSLSLKPRLSSEETEEVTQETIDQLETSLKTFSDWLTSIENSFDSLGAQTDPRLMGDNTELAREYLEQFKVCMHNTLVNT